MTNESTTDSWSYGQWMRQYEEADLHVCTAFLSNYIIRDGPSSSYANWWHAMADLAGGKVLLEPSIIHQRNFC